MKVLKINGLTISDHLADLKKVIQGDKSPRIIVTDALEITPCTITVAILKAMEGDQTYKKVVKDVEAFHVNLIKKYASAARKASAMKKIASLSAELEQIVHGVYLVREVTERVEDRIVSFAELMGAEVIASVLDTAAVLDPSKIIAVVEHDEHMGVDFDLSNKNIKAIVKKLGKLTIVPGGIGVDEDGMAISLGDGGADLTASVIAAAVGAKTLELWTDAEGFMTADKSIVPTAYAIEKMSYTEAMELSHFGAGVFYPPSILPVYEKNIPVHIKSFSNGGKTGTIICKEGDNRKGKQIKGLSSIEDVSLINVQGIGMVGVPGIAKRLFGILADEGINVILISQASSENSISFAVSSEMAPIAKHAIKREFSDEIKEKRISKVQVEEDLAIVAIVGENMKHTPGISGKLFNGLGKNGINVIAIAQGASETNISIVVNQHQLNKALNLLHQSFFLSEYVEQNLFLVGTGVVGGSLLKQIHQQQASLQKNNALKINVVGIGNIDGMLFDTTGIAIPDYAKLIKQKGIRFDLKGFAQHIIQMNLPNSVFVDCTASAEVAALYKPLLSSNVSVVAANKIACASDYKHYKELKDIAKEKGVKFNYETNVGAGLPIIGTINDMMKSGDRILRIEAVLSGTLNFIVNTLSDKLPMSKVIQMAKEKGFSEPDPRIDLSGKDVARKILILAREAGYKLEFKDVNCIPFLPKKYMDTKSLDEFWKVVHEVDGPFEKERKVLEKEGKRWRYVATFEKGKASTSLKAVIPDSPLYNLEGSNSIILITTERYYELPMVIKGYGAGSEVTAAGVFADIIKIVNL